MQEPYHSFAMLVNFNSSEYIFRVLGTTKERGFYSNIDDLREIVENKFANTVSSLDNIYYNITQHILDITIQTKLK